MEAVLDWLELDSPPYRDYWRDEISRHCPPDSIELLRIALFLVSDPAMKPPPHPQLASLLEGHLSTFGAIFVYNPEVPPIFPPLFDSPVFGPFQVQPEDLSQQPPPL